ncbi:hypothetical protein B0T19DRAFT_292510 [Cercophora scortea]|uniref:Uncharacterized protein n=1 Tax=Cercophora scortea TaxID=314031 RepID=A0AAE0M3M0_9PEZI|nr:hypothetical protein B0T19DRAFT_292510 [Cercophora scortea]
MDSMTVSIAASGPSAWLFYVVASVGPKGSHRPLAVTFGEHADGAREDDTMRGSNLLRICQQIIAILSDPDNRLAIRGEMRLAEEFYRSQPRIERTEVPDLTRLIEGLGLNQLEGRTGIDGDIDGPERGWDRSHREFPFISTCLLLGAGYDPSTGVTYSVRTEPLGTAYCDDDTGHGMVVLDISDLDNIRYGIVGFFVHLMIDVDARFEDRDGDYDPVEDILPEEEPMRVIEDDRPREPLSASGYMDKFHYRDPDHVAQTLERRSLVDTRALDYIWPDDDAPDWDLESKPDLANTDTAEPRHDSTRPLSDQTIITLIESTQEKPEIFYDMSVFNHVRLIPSFAASLLRLMEAYPDRLGPGRSAGRLLNIAYAGRKHLDWTPYRYLSANGIAAALRAPGLQGTKSFVFRLGPKCGNTAELALALPRLVELQQLCVLQDPTRTEDEPSAKLFAQLSAEAAQDSFVRRLLQIPRLVFSGAHSAALRKAFWLPTTTFDYQQPICAFPVQQMFVRHQLATPTRKFWPNYFYLGDMPLSPERFAAGFLRFLRTINDDENLFTIASAPPDLESMSAHRASVSNLPAEVFSIPLRPQRGECWSKARDLVPGGWTVLVSQERHHDAEAAVLNAKDHRGRPTEARFIKYAFVRARAHVRFSQLPPHEVRGELGLSTDNIDIVCGLDEFLRATAPEGVVVDSALVKRRLDELVRDLVEHPAFEPARRVGQAKLDPGMEWLSVLGEQEACDMLRDFFEDAAFVRRNLRLAMEKDPNGTCQRQSPPPCLHLPPYHADSVSG